MQMEKTASDGKLGGVWEQGYPSMVVHIFLPIFINEERLVYNDVGNPIEKA